MNSEELIVRDPKILGGKPVIRGTRISVEFILRLIENAWSIEKICREYGLKEEQVIAAIKYARKIIEKQILG
ncbi:MAG: DUF433 domain-containing protein [Candidatus Njordarchaeota archaeon]